MTPENLNNSGFVDWDFIRYFPYKHWISNWANDDEYPDGYCYKLMTSRDTVTQKTDVVLVLAKTDGNKKQMLRHTVPSGDLDRAAKLITEDIGEQFGLDFQEQDYSQVRTFDELVEVSQTFGWIWKKPDAEC
jgi:hypothetical protein